MSEPSRSDAPDFYLRYLRDYVPPDLDSEVRACRSAGSLQVGANREGLSGTEELASTPSSLLHVIVEPPLRMMGKDEKRILLGPYYVGSDLVLPHDRSLVVTIYRVTDWSGVSADKVALDVLHQWLPAHIASTASLLPLTREHSFQRSLANLQRFAAREGHTDVPLHFKENGQHLGVWVGNARRFPQSHDKAAQLAAIPGWRWLSSEDLRSLRSYAERQGHTDPPATREFEDAALENVVSQVRTQNRRGLVSLEEIRDLEEVPHWHW